MAEYYFDIETYSPGERPDTRKDKVITIQFQKLSTSDGSPVEPLRILTEWGCGSERALLENFKPYFFTGNPFDFIPVGMNLYGFDLPVVLGRLNAHFGLNLDFHFYRDRPIIDLKSTLVIHNGGRLKGWSDWIGKTKSGDAIKQWYEDKNYQEIEKYVKDEASLFLSKYQLLKRELPKLK